MHIICIKQLRNIFKFPITTNDNNIAYFVPTNTQKKKKTAIKVFRRQVIFNNSSIEITVGWFPIEAFRLQRLPLTHIILLIYLKTTLHKKTLLMNLATKRC